MNGLNQQTAETKWKYTVIKFQTTVPQFTQSIWPDFYAILSNCPFAR